MLYTYVSCNCFRISMENLTGKWVGQYVQQSIDKDYVDSFELEIDHINGEIKGTSIDLNLNNEPGIINGFYENGILSFIKKYHRLIFQDEQGDIMADDSAESMEITYTATYDESEKAFIGFWEIHLGGEQVSYQEEFLDDFERGDFFMRKIG